MNIKNKNYPIYVSKKLEEYRTNGKMTVAYFIDTYFPLVDGVVSVLHNYAVHLMDKINVIVCAPAHKNMQLPQEYLVISCKSNYVKMIHYDYATPAADRRFARLLDQAKIDLVHLHSPFMLGAYGLKLARKRHIPVVATFHSQYKNDFMNYTHNSRALTSILLSTIMKVFNSVDLVYTMHDYSKNTLLSYGYRGEVRFLPNATNEFYPENPQELVARINREYNLEGKENVLLFVGRLTRVKNIFFILDVLSKLKEENFPFHMIYVGSGPDEKELHRTAEKLGLSENVTFTGNISERETLKGFYLRSNLFLFPSGYDVSSIVQIEAASQKLCGLFLRGSVTSCTVTDNRTGFLCDEDVDQFSEKIIQIFSDPSKLEQISEQAYEELYVNWDMLADRILEEYQRFLSEVHPSARERRKRLRLQSRIRKNKLTETR